MIMKIDLENNIATENDDNGMIIKMECLKIGAECTVINLCNLNTTTLKLNVGREYMVEELQTISSLSYPWMPSKQKNKLAHIYNGNRDKGARELIVYTGTRGQLILLTKC